MKGRRNIAIVCVALAAGGLYLKGGSLAGAVGVLSQVLAEMASTLLLLGGALLARAIWVWRKSVRVAGWPTVAGSVTAARVESAMRQPLTTYRPVRSRWYRPHVTYEYVVNGKRFEGTQIRLGAAGWEREEQKARIVMEPYPVGTSVRVRYNPGRPADAVLEPGLGSLWVQTSALGIACVVLGMYGWVYGAAIGL